MQTKHRDLFTTIQTEGALLPADLLKRIADGDLTLAGLRAEDYHLAPGEKLNEAINRSWNRLQGTWASFQAAIAKLGAHDPGTTITRERWLLPLFSELGYGRLLTARATEIDGKSYPISHAWDKVPIHLVGFRIHLDHRAAGVAGAARTSPHSLVQEFLNRSDDNLWAFVSNGLRLRILRDNTSLTRQAYVQFDLEAMMNGELYADFVLLWLLCHQSRVEGEKLEDFWLEKWSRMAQEQGIRALDTLRVGVQQAIEALGRGFLAHPANRALRDKLRAGELSEQDYYRQLLRLVYRLLFLFAAEDRDLLLDPAAPEAARARYSDYYSTRRLRDLAQRRRGTRHSDLYHGLRIVMDLLGRDDGGPALGLPALGSFLFTGGAAGAIPDLEAAEIANHDLLSAVRELAFTVAHNVLRPVDYRNMGAEELGSVYEALLELHPRLNADAGSFALETVSGNERKTTGSYYTPSSLINALLDSALDPVLDEAARMPDAAAAILGLKICDPACGSGHFLIAAAHRIARRLAATETGDDEPGPDAMRSALRKVIGRCIYGVDLNPMAVELCKVSLWMEALEPGKPLSFLDHHIQVGNSLLGATPALLNDGIPDAAFEPITGDDKRVCSEYKRQNKQERAGQERLLGHDLQPWEQLGNLATAMSGLDDLEDSSVAAVRRKQRRFEELVQSQAYRNGRLLADAWCAAFVWKKSSAFPHPITDAVFRKIERNPFDLAPWMHDEIQRLAGQYQFFHWHLAFPDVFHPAPALARHSSPQRGGDGGGVELAGWRGGFDVVLGNPPWEHTELKEKEWFASRRPEIAEARTGAERKRRIDALAKDDPALHEAFLDARRFHDGQSHFAGNSGRFPLCGRGRINTYAIFAETNRLILGPTGRVGCIVQSDIATADTNKDFFRNLLETKQLVSLYDFVNTEGIFPAIHRTHPHFCLLTISGQSISKAADFAFWNTNVGHLAEQDRHFTLAAQDLALLNPNTRTCPIFRSKRDAELTKAIYRRVPVLIREGEPEQNPWGVSFRQGLFNMTSDSGLFRTREQLEAEGWQLSGNIFRRGDDAYLPLYEAKMIHHFDHRWATYDGLDTRDLALPEKSDPACVVLPRYWVPAADVAARLAGRWERGWLLGWRDITNTTNERTVIAGLVPRVGVGNKIPLMLLRTGLGEASGLLANLSAFVYDYASRQKIGGTTLNFFIYQQLPVLPPATYAQPAPWAGPHPVAARHPAPVATGAGPGVRIADWLLPRVLELIYTAWDLAPFAHDCGYDGPPFRWDEERRFLLRCELDAAFFHLYGIARADVDYIMDSFPIVRRKDEAAHGEYRTRRVILEIYDAMQRATETGEPYRTLLDPPPADPRVAHPPRAGMAVAPALPRRPSPTTGEGIERRHEPILPPAPNERPSQPSAAMPTRPAPQSAARAALREQPQPYTSQGNGGSQRPLFEDDEDTAAPTGNDYRVGQRVRHRQFGVGAVIAVQGAGSDQVLTVRFASAGTKKLMARLANLERVG